MLLVLQPTRQEHIVDAIGNTLKGGVGKYQFFADERFQDTLRIGRGADIVFLDELGDKKVQIDILFMLKNAKKHALNSIFYMFLFLYSIMDEVFSLLL